METATCTHVLTWPGTLFQPSPPPMSARVNLTQTLHLFAAGCAKELKEVAEAKCPLLCFLSPSQSQHIDKELKLLLNPHAAGLLTLHAPERLFPLAKSGPAGDCFLLSFDA